MAQLQLKLSQEQAEMTSVCAENIRAELDLYTVFLSSAEGPSFSHVDAALNVLFQLGVALAKNHGLDPDEAYMGAKSLVCDAGRNERGERAESASIPERRERESGTTSSERLAKQVRDSAKARGARIKLN
jgi:hypothetical protein